MLGRVLLEKENELLPSLFLGEVLLEEAEQVEEESSHPDNRSKQAHYENGDMRRSPALSLHINSEIEFAFYLFTTESLEGSGSEHGKKEEPKHEEEAFNSESLRKGKLAPPTKDSIEKVYGKENGED